MKGRERNLKTSEKKVKGKEWEQGGSQWREEKRWANRRDRGSRVYLIFINHMAVLRKLIESTSLSSQPLQSVCFSGES